MLEAAGEIIALDLDLGAEARPATVSAEGLTPCDLDALMENLDTECAHESAA